MGGVQLSRNSAVPLQIHLAAQLHPQRLILLFLQLRYLVLILLMRSILRDCLAD